MSVMKNLYDTRAVREMERAAFAREDSFAVMRRAGNAVAGHALQMIRGDTRPILILAGPGNNGGDAFVAAAKLQTAGRKICAVFVGDENRLPPDARRAFSEFRSCGGEIMREIPAAENKYALAVDGLFGIGLSRPVDGIAAELLRQIRGIKTLSIDAPSGIDGDTGAAFGETAIASRTLTFFGAKPGLYTGDGIAAAGEIAVDDLGFIGFPKPCGKLLDSAEGLNLYTLRRTKNSHKGVCGAAAIVGGAAGMFGALVLASRAAVRLGAGKVFALSASVPPSCDFGCPETMWRKATELPQISASCIAIGPGLGAENVALFRTALDSSAPIVADADALNILAADSDLAAYFARRKSASVITPHLGEAARLLQTSANEIHSDRIGAAKTLAKKYNAVVVLKGAGTIVADSAGEWAICAAGNPGLSQAGAGDVLTGILAALVAQTGDAKFSARAAVFLHSAAADELAQTGGEIGLDLNAIPFTAAKILNRAVNR